MESFCVLIVLVNVPTYSGTQWQRTNYTVVHTHVNDYSYPGRDIVLHFCRMLLVEDLGEGRQALLYYY